MSKSRGGVGLLLLSGSVLLCGPVHAFNGLAHRHLTSQAIGASGLGSFLTSVLPDFRGELTSRLPVHV